MKHASHSRLYATGSSVGGSAPCNTGDGLPAFQLPLGMEVAVSHPVSLSITETQQTGPAFQSWLARDGGDYVATLASAWACILSARWTNKMNGPCTTCILRYTDNRAPHLDYAAEQHPEPSTIHVDIGNVTPEETRWWLPSLLQAEVGRRLWLSSRKPCRLGQLTSS